jgi:hypothetical protein
MSLNKPNWNLRDWIDINKLNSDMLSLNPNAIQLLEVNPEKINWEYLSNNKNTIHFQEKLDWDNLLYYYYIIIMLFIILKEI